MALRIEDYGLIGDTHSAALVGRDGSIDWLCLPRFDSDACFAALLGTPANGRWIITPTIPVRRVSRRYLPDTLVLETELETDAGVVQLVDFMPIRRCWPAVLRLVVGVRGRVPMQLTLCPRFGYGRDLPWIAQTADENEYTVLAGPDALRFRGPAQFQIRDSGLVAELSVTAGERLAFELSWHPSPEPAPKSVDVERALVETRDYWRDWAARASYEGPWRDAVVRSLITLKALTYSPTAGIAAAPTTSLPERIGGVRNWDYRFCWLRDATMTLFALMNAGYREEAQAWRDWLVRAIAGDPKQFQITYGVGGERRLPELELDWLAGYEGSVPVRIGNAASSQIQLDVWGETMDCLHHARDAGVPENDHAWTLQRSLIDHLESNWQNVDHGIWETRAAGRHFTHSKVMAWVAMDRAVRSVERFGMAGPLQRWSATRAAIHADVCAHGYDTRKGCFTRAYGDPSLDASLLMIPQVGFLPVNDPRVIATVDAITRELWHEGFVRRYDTGRSDDGLPSGEGVFLACSFWLADVWVLMGRTAPARELFERLLTLRNDLGLLAEEYDPIARRLLGNFPQAFSHVALVNTAFNLSHVPQAKQPAAQRAAR